MTVLDARASRRRLVLGTLLLIPLAVAVSRLYRGTHHPSDVVAGVLNGACTLLVVAYAVLLSRPGETRASAASAPAAPGGGLPAARTCEDGGTAGLGARRARAVVVRHPHACGEGSAARVRAVLRRHGYEDQVWTLTSVEDPCGALPAHVAGAETELVVVCGGDGTVRACADVVAGTGIALAIVPCGTGNLLARNLRLPSDPAAALREALSGQPIALDVGRVRGDGLAPARFTVMSGAGFDAAMVRDASARLKEHLGWAAYLRTSAKQAATTPPTLPVRVRRGLAETPPCPGS
ncbi:diacylglycerol kinase family protein [Streptomyces sp. NBC_01351]|uniref:diacylglycerol kinase family protein n=1 Tax=Streptomyces sp. NBC_01351 TaxID=2903833 RepID=UPI002E37782E|nr:diacylglycerol kinase family protein [Streptomyces sp. NBC_01351]